MFLAVAGTQVVNLGTANPYSQAQYSGVTASPSGTGLPVISIFSPLNYTTIDTNNITLSFRVSAGQSGNGSRTWIDSVYYRADWMQTDIKVNVFELPPTTYYTAYNLQKSITLAGAPAGNHSITLYATETGRYYPDFFHYHDFYVTASSWVSFAIDAATVDANAVDEREKDKEAPMDVSTNLPTVTVLRTSNGTAYKTNDIVFALAVNFGLSSASARNIQGVYYEADWQRNNALVRGSLGGGIEFSDTVFLQGIPEGRHTIVFNASEQRQYEGYNDYAHNLHYRVFKVTTSIALNFIIDTQIPTVTISSLEGTTNVAPDVPLNFVVSEPGTNITYRLDGHEAVTINGNTTLTGLSEGFHYVKVYAVDQAGNVGSSEMVSFTVEASSTTLVAAVSGAAVAALVIGVAVYFKKTKRNQA